jgi:hypothetical protein
MSVIDGVTSVSGTSEDFNASIASVAASDAAINWNYTDTGASKCVNVAIRADHIDVWGTSGRSIQIIGSPSHYMADDDVPPQRLG